MSKKFTIALAGQPNCGKSTLFNLLTGARQYVANYPGVTVEKLGGSINIDGQKIEVVDLPGTYAFTSFSNDERAARDFILNENPQVVVAVLDASTIEKGLYFTLQLLEMGRPVILVLNMMDVAERRGLYIDAEQLSRELGIPVVPMQATDAKSEGRGQLINHLREFIKEDKSNDFVLEYENLEPFIKTMADDLSEASVELRYPQRWLALRLLERDPAILEKVATLSEELKAKIFNTLDAQDRKIAEVLGSAPVTAIATRRHARARAVSEKTVEREKTADGLVKKTFTEKVDSVTCHRIMGPICLFIVLFTFYQVSVTFGNQLAAKVWPFWAGVEASISSVLPYQGFLEDPVSTSLVEWVVKSLTAVMNYIPIFILMFAFVSILEGSGYLARIAFILDRVFHSYGLHGQSTLPLILAGVYVGGCAIPGVVATKAIPDERARFSTILVVPMMNCLAKVPLYFLLIGGFFAATAGSAMFFMGTITLLMALIVSKLLNLTVLKGHTSAPFIMELPAYHMPIFRNVIQETFRKVVTFIQRILSVVLVVSTVVFVLVFFPNLSQERIAHYETLQVEAEDVFMAAVAKTEYAATFTKEDILPLIRYQETLREDKRGVTKEQAAAINEAALKESPIYASIVLRKGKDGRALAGALRTIDSKRKSLRREMRSERFESSYLGRAGKALGVVTEGAGFTWRINVALLSALAAKENSAATLGALYGFEGGKVGDSFAESGFTPLHALALMLFMALYPPCLPAAMMVKNQTGSLRWMIFSIIFQMTIGLFVATLIFSGGTALNLTGVQAMWTFYALCLSLVIILGFIKPKEKGLLDNNTISA